MPNDDSDLLRPDFHFSNEVLTRSRSTWSAVASAAQSATNLPSACCNVKAFLNKTPSIPESSGATDRIGSNSLYTQGYIIDIGTDDFAEVQWWAAILAEGRGCPFRLHHRAHLPSAISPINLEPLSSAQAQEYLFNLARYHDAFDQLISALAATMTIPLHNRFGASITLPLPQPGHSPISHRNTE
ncbi:hypothetical protein BDV37DRAFT_278536 [Aspergillus pseudonomiae]|uniref:Uncharacterized protein n=1 Tax=Aspergillus pseudonomiae TaxID=1506151 RepID=A0A5N7DU33_9EURO|nr:uncharacterized protein BDV37DRAFT_278536 [Aspergillus pseudonomiae]KAE8409028.1 hypothetical protein BDV37DRAFT_278536 [Aspergillus pseudonomiae]